MSELKGINHALSEALGIEPIQRANTEVVVAADENKANTDVLTDYDVSRKAFTDMIVKGTKAVQEVLDIASATEHPRNYEAAAALIKSMTDATRELMEIHKKRAEIESKTATPPNNQHQGGMTIENAQIFVGSPTEMMRRVRNARKPVEKPPEPIDVESIEVKEDGTDN